ncbi:PQQ-dependent sugar dehydrogenase [Streptomonospora nanhaiensis]|uniref:Glucose/arabinose dehydrogenase n=1 Tax=Streptomonospora nanhaiensis TaxID=1323731 RepID=A0A853BSU2_9ACTN|nr:PQQ-dependent sugar dehydrogenase [Streptomonospora nanhaiensis]MBV2366554.1 PQQ-dependent sugar dehydrogenase [Streptomonospora nanhaiensis]MBX9391686.1 PQQ-dependent sugar dehydrogenase [Streptomonospora nanhaiensis]NYI98213.1 glucose/arabinose dehydrogenase [Streptomonospora nanhaiensis]
MPHNRWARRASAAAAAAVLGALTAISPASANDPSDPGAASADAPLPLDRLRIATTVTDADLDRPTAVAAPDDGSGRLFITEKEEGTVRVYHPDTGLAAEPLLDIGDRISVEGNEQGLLGIAPSPDFAEDPALYVAYTATDWTLTLSRFPLEAPDQTTVPAGAEEVLLTQEHAEFNNHNGGDVHFGPDGHLYWSLGDGGGAGDPLNNGQNLGTLLGTIVRIDVSRACGDLPYCVPEDNPFVGVADARPEIWVYGLRNPWRFSFDPVDGSLWIGDVGQGFHEEVDHLPAGEGGANFGWPCREGPALYDEARCDAGADYEEPVFSYTHEGSGCSVTGGVVYRGEEYADIAGGTYVVTDYCSNIAWGIRPTGGGEYEAAEIGALPIQVTAFGADGSGELYVVNDLPGRLYRVSFEALPPPVDCAVDYTVDSQWGSGFTASVVVTNTGDDPIDGWTLAWDYTGGQRVTNGWQARVAQEGASVTAANLDWNRVIAPGGTVRFGVHGSHTGANPAPAEFSLNGSVCEG